MGSEILEGKAVLGGRPWGSNQSPIALGPDSERPIPRLVPSHRPSSWPAVSTASHLKRADLFPERGHPLTRDLTLLARAPQRGIPIKTIRRIVLMPLRGIEVSLSVPLSPKVIPPPPTSRRLRMQARRPGQPTWSPARSFAPEISAHLAGWREYGIFLNIPWRVFRETPPWWMFSCF